MYAGSSFGLGRGFFQTTRPLEAAAAPRWGAVVRWGVAPEGTNTSAPVYSGIISRCATCDPSTVLVCAAGRMDGIRDSRLVEVDVSVPVGHVSAGSIYSGSARMKSIPLFGCRSIPLESFGGTAFPAVDGDLLAYILPVCFEEDMVDLKTALFLVSLYKVRLSRGLNSVW